MEYLMNSVSSTFDQSTNDDLREFLSRFPNCKNFIVASDYCIKDKQKNNDVISFAIYPYASMFNTHQEIIKEFLPRDIKKVRSTPDELIEYVESGNVFIVNFISPRNEKRLFKNLPKDHVKYSIDAMIDMLGIWIDDRPHRDDYREMKKKMIQLREECKRKNFNINLFTDIMIVATLSAYLSYKVLKYSEASDVVWMSDRDPMTKFCSEIIYDIYAMQKNGLSRNDNDYLKKDQLGYGTCKENEKCWYDDIIRIPDYFAGAYAEFNYNTTEKPDPKFLKVLGASIVSNVANIIIEQHSSLDVPLDIRASRLAIEGI